MPPSGSRTATIRPRPTARAMEAGNWTQPCSSIVLRMWHHSTKRCHARRTGKTRGNGHDPQSLAPDRRPRPLLTGTCWASLASALPNLWNLVLVGSCNLHAVVYSRHVPHCAAHAWGLARCRAWGLARCGHHCFNDGRAARQSGSARIPCRSARMGEIHYTMCFCIAAHTTLCGKGGMLKIRLNP